MLRKEFYCGAYALCKLSKKEILTSYNYCPNTNCNEFKKSSMNNFCFHCGSKIIVGQQTRLVNVVDELAIEDLDILKLSLIREKTFESEIKYDVDVWINRIYNNSKNVISFASSTTDVKEMTNKITEDLNNFIESFEEELNKLKKIYGNENVTVHWGYLHYLNN